MGRYKSIVGNRLRSRKFANQQKEVALGCSALNRMLDWHGQNPSAPQTKPHRATIQRPKSADKRIRAQTPVQGIVPRVIVTDKLRSYGVAKREIIPSVERSSHKSLNTRAENSHPPLPRTERILHRFKSTRHQMTSSDFRDLRHPAI